MRFYLLTLGCPKNVADSEGMSVVMKQSGYRQTSDPDKADVLIVNTCGFLQVAREESESALRDLAAGKRPGQILVAAGCLPQRYGAAVMGNTPGIDGIIGTRQWTNIARFANTLRARRVSAQDRVRLGGLTGDDDALVATVARGPSAGSGHGPRAVKPTPSAYLKIGDGCSAPCTFCTIPSFKGLQKSKPAAQVIAEARDLVARGTREIVLVAQDSTAYGRDWGAKDALPELIEAVLEAAPDLNWLRLMYAYPGHVSPRLAETMARQTQVVHYLDVPLQHGAAGVLRRMKRPSPEVARRMIESLRAAMPDIAIRSTFIVGYPGETETEFQELLDFLSDAQLDRVGAFTFSPEPGTPAAEQADQLPQEIKAERYARLMEHQREISLAKNRALVGREMDVLIEGANGGISVGRSYRDAPEVDGVVLVQQSLRAGAMARARVTGAMEYDLIAEIKAQVKTGEGLLQIAEPAI
ncbi:MAG: 30S ribosomal protein S12 methylthiotransferase RimO [Chloroflexi bacterium]|nr:30S ribosomal protein S12 methylthiotransferase RimO [Chloroflexota bacterium]